MPGVFDCAGFTSGLRCSSLMMWPSACPYGVGTPNEMDFAAQYPACLCPYQRFACHLAANTRMTRGQDGSLFLSCRTLSFLTPYRFIPAHMGNIGSHVGPYLGVGTNIKRKRTRSGPTPVHRLCVLLTDSRLLLLG